MKRLFDLTVASLLLLMTAPILIVVAVLIRFDTPGPVLYRSLKVGKQGKIFSMVRFRTVDVSKPAYLNMSERLTSTGRMIRERSLDDLPNLFNVFLGDLSIIGPRPTEPERVDLADPVWQQILTVRPGMISPAILLLARQYNASPHALKQQLELDYVQNHSFTTDLRLFWQGIRGTLVSKGNWKARGTPALVVDAAGYQQQAPLPSLVSDHNLSLTNWMIDELHHPDLAHVARFVQTRGSAWAPYVPQVCLVPCEHGEQKPALFLLLEHDYEQWSRHVELVDIRWPVVSSSRYTCLGCVLFLQNSAGALIYGGAVATLQEQPHHAVTSRLMCSTILDVASPAVEAWFSACRHLRRELPLFFVQADRREICHRFYAIQPLAADHLPVNARAFQQWEETKLRLERSGCVLDNFVHEYEFLRRTLPHRTSWATLDSALGTG